MFVISRFCAVTARPRMRLRISNETKQKKLKKKDCHRSCRWASGSHLCMQELSLSPSATGNKAEETPSVLANMSVAAAAAAALKFVLCDYFTYQLRSK